MYCDHPGCCSGCNQEDETNEVQAKAWTEAADEILNQHPRVSLHALAIGIAYKCNVRTENFSRMTLQIGRFIRECGKYEVHKGKSGGVFRTPTLIDEMAKAPVPVQDAAFKMMSGHPFTERERLLDVKTGTLPPPMEPIVSVTVNDYTCGCGNTKCNKTEKSCWKCGAAIKA